MRHLKPVLTWISESIDLQLFHTETFDLIGTFLKLAQNACKVNNRPDSQLFNIRVN